MKSPTTLVLLATLFAGCVTVQHTESHSQHAAEAFEVLKSLTGIEWHGEGGSGAEHHTVDVSYELACGGTVVMERLFPKSEHEMISMYHRDGDRLLMTHYCGAGNQPRMQLVGFTAAPEPTLSFDYVDATNLSTPEGLVMHSMRLSVIDKEHINTSWTAFVDGKPNHTGDFRFSRMRSLGY
jgi:hypothetical protein